jgi:alcohol dehydrogenase class IV
MAHQLGGLYHTPHGLANAILLGPVLRFLSPAITVKLAELALRAKVGKKGEPEAVLAQKFLNAIDAMNSLLGIPATLAALVEADIPALARAACREADANYPVPLYMSQADCEGVIRQVLPQQPVARAVGRRRVPAKKTRAAA